MLVCTISCFTCKTAYSCVINNICYCLMFAHVFGVHQIHVILSIIPCSTVEYHFHSSRFNSIISINLNNFCCSYLINEKTTEKIARAQQNRKQKNKKNCESLDMERNFQNWSHKARLAKSDNTIILFAIQSIFI